MPVELQEGGLVSSEVESLVNLRKAFARKVGTAKSTVGFGAWHFSHRPRSTALK